MFAIKGDYQSYIKLKKSFEPKSWYPIKHQILSAIVQNAKLEDGYVKSLFEEGEKFTLLNLLAKEPYRVYDYYKYLLPEYKEELCNIRAEQIYKMVNGFSRRKAYQAVCNEIRFLASIGGMIKAKEIKVYILTNYSKRPAFIDVINKLKF